MKRHYYACFEPGSLRDRGPFPDKIRGVLYRFPSREARDAWVAAGYVDGKNHRDALTRAKARHSFNSGFTKNHPIASWREHEEVESLFD